MRLIYYFTLLISVVSSHAATASFIALQRPGTKTSNHHQKLVHHHINQPPSLSSYPKSKLHLASTTTNTIVAGTTLILSSTTGILFEKKYISNGGHVVTLLTSALLSNLSQVLPHIRSIPTNHYLYDWCWSVFLPASLVFALLSSSPSSSMSNTSQKSTQTNSSQTNNSKAILKSTIQGMTIPFILGSIGSILGCISSYHFISMPYTRDVSALLAGCLCASYIGGTVNFFATANVLKSSLNDVDLGSAFGSMASADLIVMAIYFGMLQTASKSNWLHKLIPSKVSRGDVSSISKGEEDNTTSNKQSNRINQQQTITSSIIASSIALSSVLIATNLEQKVTSTFNIPGTMCAFLAILGLIYQRLIHVTISSHQEWKPGAKALSSFTCFIKSLQGISGVAPTLSNICFYLLFAAVGTAADLSSAIVGGPSALIFASLALLVHSITVCGGTWIGMRLLNSKSKVLNKKFGWPSSSWEEVLTASNAAIGGPSTASAFAVGLIPSENKNDNVTNDKRSQYRSALVIGATFWGVFGYAIATSIGVALSRMLMRC